MSVDMAEEIRAQEESAKAMITNAKKEASRKIAEARTIGEQSLKESKQRFHRYFREEIAKAEAEAEGQAKVTLEQGHKNADTFYDENHHMVKTVADWLVKEVKTTYGAG